MLDTIRRNRAHVVKTALLVTVGFWLIAGLVLAGVVWYANRHLSRRLQIGDMAPTFALHDQNGRPHKLDDYRSRPVAIAFLPDLGPASVTELRAINAKIAQFDTLGVKVFAATPTDAATAKRVHDTERLNFPLLLDDGRRLAATYGSEAAEDPQSRASYVIGGDGRVLLPVATVHVEDHGQQLVELTECCLDKKPQKPSRLIGKPIADFALPRVADGKAETLYGGQKPRATVLFVLSAECPCSGAYDARVGALARLYAGKGIRFLALNASANEKPAEIAQRAKEAGYPFPVLKDAGNAVADRLEAQVTPEAFVMDAQGVLRYHGRIDDNRNATLVQSHDLRNALDLLLAGQNPRRADAPTFGCAIYRVEKGASR